MAKLDNRVRVEVLLDAPTLATASFGTPLIAGDPTFSDRIRYYDDAEGVAADAGVLPSQIRDALNLAFGVTPKPSRIAVGKLNARVAQVVEIEILSVVVDDEFEVSINGSSIPTIVAGVAPTPSAIVDALKIAVDALGEPVTTTDLGTKLRITSSIAGLSFEVEATSDTPANVAVVETTANVGWAEGLDAIRAAADDWFGLVMVEGSRASNAEVAAWVQANDKIFVAWTSDTNALVPGNVDNGLTDLLAFENTATLYREAGADQKGYAVALAWAAGRLAVNPDDATTIWSYATIAGATPTILSATQRDAVKQKSGNVYGTFFGQGATAWGWTGTGRKIDVLVTKYWVQARVREAIARELMNASARGSKIPYTDEGFAVLRNVTRSVLRDGIEAGHFVDATDVVVVPSLSTVSPSDALARRLPFTFGARLAGAVEDVDVSGTVSVNFAGFA